MLSCPRIEGYLDRRLRCYIDYARALAVLRRPPPLELIYDNGPPDSLGDEPELLPPPDRPL
jgi:hypothetical protein